MVLLTREGRLLCLSGEESTCQSRRLKCSHWVGKIPWRREWQPTPVFLPGKSHGCPGGVQSMGLQNSQMPFSNYTTLTKQGKACHHSQNHVSLQRMLTWSTSSFSAIDHTASQAHSCCHTCHHILSLPLSFVFWDRERGPQTCVVAAGFRANRCQLNAPWPSLFL